MLPWLRGISTERCTQYHLTCLYSQLLSKRFIMKGKEDGAVHL